jgi:hypothetical protein
MDPLTIREARARDLESARRRLARAKLAAVAASVLSFGAIAGGIAINTPAVTAADGTATTTANTGTPAVAAPSPTATSNGAPTSATTSTGASTTTRKTAPSRVVSAQS